MLWSVISIIALVIAIPLAVWIIRKILKTGLKVEHAIPILGILIAIILSFIRLTYYPFIPKVESCNYIEPLIVQPIPDKAVSSPTTVQGTVNQVPTSSYLWLMVYDFKKEKYINASQITINGEKKWRQQVDFIGSMAGSKVNLDVILADKSTHMELNRFQESRQVPLGIIRCARVNVTLRGNYE